MRDFEAEEQIRQRERERKRAETRRRVREQQRRQQRRFFLCLGIGAVVLLLLLGSLLLKKPSDSGVKKEEEQTGADWNPEITDLENMSSAMEEGSAATEEDLAVPNEERAEEKESEETIQSDERPVSSLPIAAGYAAKETDQTAWLGSDSVQSSYALLVDLADNTIVAQKGAYDRINPASMTKILTVLVAAERITDLDDTFTITREITDFSYSNDCSAVGFLDEEVVTVKDLLYGTILPSGGDAAAGLACYVAGSMEAFVDLMNEKLKELNVADTAHMTNCVGLYDSNHYCSIYDMAMILKAAVENDLCREVLSAHTYTTSATAQHPEGIQISNWFLRRIEDKDTKGEVVCAKTGYVVQSGNCAASYEVTDSGNYYICVTANAHSSWRCIYDHVAVYQEYTK